MSTSAIESYLGPNGRAVRLALNPKLPGYETTVTWWLLTGSWHPLWSQFIISVVHLRDLPGAPPAQLHFPGATHELVVMALNPGNPPRKYAAKRLEKKGISLCGYLNPLDVVHQFEATDEEMTQIAELCAQGCVEGVLNPSTDDSRTELREAWLAACVRTLAHIRGEEHSP